MRVFIFLMLFLAWGGIFQGNTLKAQTACPQLELRLDKLTCRDVTVFWRVPANIPSYEVKYKNLSTNWDSSFTTNQSSVYLVLPQGGHNYQVEVTYLCGGRPVVSTLEFAVPACPVPCPEPAVTVNDVKCDGASISWNLIPNVYDYTVVYHAKGNPSDATTLTPNATNAVLALAPSQTYDVTVSYPCEGRVVSKTIEISTPSCPRPCPPLNPVVEAVACSAAVITWPPVSAETNYIVSYSAMNDSTGQTIETNTNRVELNLLPSNSYFVVVSYICNGRKVETPVTVNTPACPAPCNRLQVRITNVTCRGAVLTWLPGANAPDSYTVTYRPANSSASQTQQVTETRAELALQPRTPYVGEVSYICNGERVTTPIQFSTPACPPSCDTLKVRPENVTCERIVLTWNNVGSSPTTAYMVSVRSGNDSLPLMLTTTMPRIEIPAAPNTVYFIEVTYICNNQRITTPIRIETPNCPRPCPQLQVRPELITCEKATLIWNALPEVQAYDIVYTAVGDSIAETLTSATASATFNVAPNTVYKIEVSYLCNGEKITSVLEIRTPACPPNCLPLQVRPTEVTCQGAKLIWNGIPEAPNYRVTYFSANDSSHSISVNEPGVNLPLRPAQTYVIEVSYVCNGRPITTPITITTPPCPAPSCPQLDIKAESVTCERAVLRWQIVPGVSNYIVNYKSVNDSLPQIAVVNTNQASFTVSPSTAYQVQVIYLCGNQRVVSVFEFRTPACPIPCPRLSIRTESVSCESATLSWNAVAGISEYTVTYMGIGTAPQTISVNTNSATLQLNPSSVYSIVVSYMCNGQRMTAAHQLQTPACPIPCPTLRINVENLSCDKANIVWQAVPGVNFYLVSFTKVGDSIQVPPVTITTTSLPLTNLQPETGYRVEVTYICNGTRVQSFVEFKTPACVNPCPRLVIRPVNVTCQGATLTWEPLPGVDSYTVSYTAANDSSTTTLTVTGNRAQLSLNADTPYFITVSYICNGEVISTPFQVRTPACPPPCPELRISPVQLRCDSVVFAWNSAGQNVVYNVSLRKANETTGLNINVTSTNVKLPVQPSTGYRIEVAYICNGQRIVSDFNFTSPVCQVPCNRLTFRVDSLSCNGARLNWTGAAGNIIYTVIVRRANETTARNFTTPNTSIYIGDLAESSSYRAEVIYVCNGQRIVSVVEFNTPACRPRNKQSREAFNSFNVYPNPSNGWVNIAYESSENVTLNVVNMSGQTVGAYKLEAQENNGSATINLTDLPKGVYMLHFSGNNARATHKLVIN